MSSKWKYFVKKYQNFCIASGIVGFLLAPFLWPFFLAILVNTLFLTVPVLLVYLVIRQLKKRPEGAEKETFKEVAENRKEKAETAEEQSLKRAAPVVKAPKQEQTVKKKMEKERSPSVSEELNEAEKVARNWYLIIIDECSMVDMHLFTSLMMKIKAGSRIVFVGDKDQLESVGPGNVFKELIDSGVIPVTVLEQCFRQENPTILENAIKINCGKQNLVYDDSFSFVAAHDDEEAAKKIVKIFDTEWNQQGKNVNAVQVLTPLREDTKVSANALNIKIKDRINPYQRGQQEIKSGNKIFRIQDKVMQTKNEDEISNGDIGIVRKIGKMNGKKYMEVDFGEERVMRYQEGESWNLVHAYAITAHKGQGSEYPVVIIPVLSCFRRHTLKRNLYYTAITRAKRRVILVGSKQAFSQAIRAGRSKKRNTLLSYRLKKAFAEFLDKNEAA